MLSWKRVCLFACACILGVSFAVHMRAGEPQRAGDKTRLLLGSVPDEAWLSQYVGNRISGKVLRGLVAGDQVVVLYQEEKAGGAVRLSVIERETELRIWEYAHGDAVTSGLSPGPLLAACRLSHNGTWDILLCVTLEEGKTNYGEKWSRHLYVFPGGKAIGSLDIPLSAMDVNFHRNEEPWPGLSSDSDPSQPALERDACVIVKPAAGLLILVSTETRLRSERDEQEPRPGPVSIQVWRWDRTHVEKREGSVAELTGLLLGGYGGDVGLVLK